MQLKGDRTLAADRGSAWAALNDIALLQRCIPGCERLAAIGQDQYEVVMIAAIGPVKASFKGRMILADADPPNAYTLKFDGSGGPAGFARGEARVALVALGARETRLSYLVDAHVGGRLAQVGSRLIDAAAGAMADQFFAAFEVQLQAQTAAGPGTPAAVAAPPATLGLWTLIKAFFRRLFSWRSG